MRSSKSRSRNKSNRQRSLGNVVNRVFDSSGPEGKVRGTPQQIIDKYLTLARDAQLSNDRVAEESFLQHAEHYTRMLGEAQREQAERQAQNQQNNHHQRQNGDHDRNGDQDQSRQNNQHRNGGQDDDEAAQADAGDQQAQPEQPKPRRNGRRNDGAADQQSGGLPDAVAQSSGESGLVETPEAQPKPKRSRTPRAEGAPRATRSRRKPADDGVAVGSEADAAAPAPAPDAAGEGPDQG